MMRRMFLRFAPFAALAGIARADRAPGELDALNAFAARYNAYIAKLRGGIVDAREWSRVEKAWRELR